MPANPNPVIAPIEARDGPAIIAWAKLHLRQTVADADEVRNGDWSDQLGGLYIKSLRGLFNLNTESTADDDGTDVIIDGAGTHWIRAADSNVPVVRTYTDSDVVAGAVTLDNDADVHLFNLTTAATLTFMPSADREGREIAIKDISNLAATNNLTPDFDGAELCDGLAGDAFAITSNYGSAKFRPLAAGWYQL